MCAAHWRLSSLDLRCCRRPRMSVHGTKRQFDKQCTRWLSSPQPPLAIRATASLTKPITDIFHGPDRRAEFAVMPRLEHFEKLRLMCTRPPDSGLTRAHPDEGFASEETTFAAPPRRSATTHPDHGKGRRERCRTSFTLILARHLSARDVMRILLSYVQPACTLRAQLAMCPIPESVS